MTLQMRSSGAKRAAPARAALTIAAVRCSTALLLAWPAASVVHGHLVPSKVPQKLPSQLPDTYKMVENIKYAVTIANTDNNTMFECMYTYRTAIDPETRTATYVIVLPNIGAEIPLYILKAGILPGRFTFTLAEDPTKREGITFYASYGNCDVTYFDIYGPQCTLWTSRALKDNVPQDCIVHFADICGADIPDHSRDRCSDP